MQDRPTTRELIQAVSGFMERELAPIITDSRLRFRLLIAINVLSIIDRELDEGNTLLRDEWVNLADLFGLPTRHVPGDPAVLSEEIRSLAVELSQRIREGEADQGSWADGVFGYAQEAVIAKLKITNPRYLERFGL